MGMSVNPEVLSNQTVVGDNHIQSDFSPRSAVHMTEAAGLGGLKLPVGRSWGFKGCHSLVSLHQTLSLSPVSLHPGSLEHNVHSQLRTHVLSADPTSNHPRP